MDEKKPKTPFGAYKKTQVTTVNRETLLLMLYEGALRFLRQGMEAAEKGDQAESTRLVGRTQEIINELRATLNYEAGGDIAKNLESLYAYMSQRLMLGLAEKNTQYFQEVMTVLETLNTAWEEAIGTLRKERAGAEK